MEQACPQKSGVSLSAQEWLKVCVV
jgi:hypothetical protein